MQILVWGIGRIAQYYMKLEYFSGFEIIGFVDSYAEKKLFMGYPVYKPSEVAAKSYDYLVICVAKDNDAILNVCIEEKVNLSKVIFLHKRDEFSQFEDKYTEQFLDIESIKTIFPLIYKDRIEKQAQRRYYENILDGVLKDSAFLYNMGENHVCVWIPVELLFSERAEDNYLEVRTDEWVEQNKRLENLPIISFTPYRDLFTFFMQGQRFPKLYCAWYQYLYSSRGLRSGYTDEELIEKRFQEFKQMQHELNKGMEFFTAAPAVAKWNPKGYFNLLDGHHRTAFLYYSGLTRIPVQITRKDYELWCNKEKAEVVMNIAVKQGRNEFYQPILNPYFFRITPYREDFAKSRLHHLLETFHPKQFVGKSVIDIGANLGYMGQAFYRMGAEVTLLEPDPVHCELLQKINELLYSECRVVAQRFENYQQEQHFDIGILFTVFYHYFSNETVRASFVKNLNKRITQMILWESGDLPDEEKAYIINHTKFHVYRRLSYTYATGKFRELGVFLTEDSEFLGDML